MKSVLPVLSSVLSRQLSCTLNSAGLCLDCFSLLCAPLPLYWLPRRSTLIGLAPSQPCPTPFPLSLPPGVTCQGLVFAASPVHLLTLPLFSSFFPPSSELLWLCLPAWHTSSFSPAPAVLWAPLRLPPLSDLPPASSSCPCQMFISITPNPNTTEVVSVPFPQLLSMLYSCLHSSDSTSFLRCIKDLIFGIPAF